MKGLKNKSISFLFQTYLLKDNTLYLNKKPSTMEIEQRNKLAAIMFDIKHKIKDGEYKEFMDILGKKEVEPNIENIRIVKLHYIDCEYINVDGLLDEEERDILYDRDGHDIDDIYGFKQERLRHSYNKTQIVEIFGNLSFEDDETVDTLFQAMKDSRLHVNQLKTFVYQMKHGNSTMRIHAYRWIHPLKYTVMDKKEN